MATPWFPMYPTDFLVSTATMTAVQGWAYTQLLMYAWTNHGIPDDRQACAALTRCELSEVDWAVIRQRFTRMAGPMATLSNPRMERERIRVEEKHATASENGRRGADARWRARNGVANGNANGNANGGANGNANGETMATTTTTTTTNIQPPIAPPSKGGRVGKSRRDRNRDLNQPQW